MSDLQNAAKEIGSLLNPQPEQKQVQEEPQGIVDQEISEEVTLEADGMEPEEQVVEPQGDATDELELGADEIAELFGLENDKVNIGEDNRLSFRVTVDGKDSEATLADMLKSYQIESSLNNRSMQLAEKEKAIESKIVELTQQADNWQSQQSEMFKSFESMLLSGYDQLDWKAIREEDPGQYAALKAERDEVKQRLVEMKQQSELQAQESVKSLNEELRKRMSEYVAMQQEEVKRSIPDWGADKIKQISSFLGNVGFDGNEINQIVDHRLIKLAHDAMLFNQGKQAAEKSLQKPVKRMIKAGRSKTKVEGQLVKYNAAKDKLKKTGSMADAVEVLKQKFS